MSFKSPLIPHVPSPSQVPVVDADPSESGFEPGEVLGSFTAWLRRPKASSQGLTAQFFGENGRDADTIAIFHLDRFLGAVVDLRIWAIKASSGKELKNDKGEYLALPSFRATVKRPASNAEGLLAQFFAANGEAADAANELNKSAYLDALLLVEVVAADADAPFRARLDEEVPQDDLKAAARRLTKGEEKQLKQAQKQASEAWRQLLQAGFFRQPSLWKALGGVEAYQRWLGTQGCCHPGRAACPNTPVQPFQVPIPQMPMPFVGMCSEHAALWETGMVTLSVGGDPMVYLGQTHEREVLRWAQMRLQEVLNTSQGYLPTPKTVVAWATGQQLTLPSSFNMFLID